MFRFVGRFARWAVVPALLLAGVYTGGADGIVGWLVLGWMVFRGGPGMWRDVRRVFGVLRGAKLRQLLPGRRRESGAGVLNA